MLTDDLVAAEDTLAYVSKKIPSLTTNKNHLYLKLGAIAYLRKDYKQSLSHYLELNLKDWNKSMRNPFYDDSISINGARNLISLSLWKSKSAVHAQGCKRRFKNLQESFDKKNERTSYSV